MLCRWDQGCYTEEGRRLLCRWSSRNQAPGETEVRCTSLVLLGAALFGTALPAQEQPGSSWPHWLGPKRDAVWRQSGVVARIPDSGLPVRWRTPIRAGFSGPSVVGGRVFVTDFAKAAGRVTNRPSTEESVRGDERVLCLDSTSGKVLWQHAYAVEYSVSYPSGPRTSPVVDGNRVYTLGTDGHLWCLDVEKGDVVWAKHFAKDYAAKTPFWGHSAHPVLHGDLLICLVGGKGSTVVAFDKRTGKEQWHAISAKEPGYCPPILTKISGHTRLVVWHPESLNALDPATGAVLWTVPLAARAGMAVTAPVHSGEHLFVSGIGTRPTLLHLDPKGGEPKTVWRGGARRGITTGNSTPVVHEGILYGFDTKGQLIASEFATGEHLWSTFQATTRSHRETYSTAFLVRHEEDRFFIFNERGDLILAELTEDGYTEFGRFHVLEPTTSTYGRKVIWSHPAFAERSMFARNDTEIVRVSLAAR